LIRNPLTNAAFSISFNYKVIGNLTVAISFGLGASAGGILVSAFYF
jgi:hypothetical protein